MPGGLGTLARGVVMIGLVLAALSGLTLLVDVARGGSSPAGLAHLTASDARNLVHIFSRASNQLVGVVFTTVAIAVPLTANMYSLKFLEYFIRDRVNAVMLVLAVSVAVNTVVIGYALRESMIPRVMIGTQFALIFLAFALLFPYLYYLFRFLHPNTLIERLQDEVRRHLDRAQKGRGLPALRRRAGEALEHLADIAVRSLDRLDRNTAIASVHALEQLAADYGRRKPSLPGEWFRAEPSLFLSFSSRAVEEVNESRSWFEMKLLSQLRQVLAAGLGRTHDVVSAAAKGLRRIGSLQGIRGDAPLRDLTVDYFNTYVRLALTARDVRSVFIVFDQYRLLAEELLDDDPELVTQIAEYFRYYGQAARQVSLPFVVEAVAHDLGQLVQRAWERAAPGADPLLESFLRYDEDGGALPGVRKAQAILASYFLLANRPEAAARIRERFREMDTEALQRVTRELLAVRREKYWEVNERRMNMDFVPEPQRAHLEDFLVAAQADGATETTEGGR